MLKILEKFNSYFEHTTLHGFSYISEGKHMIEKLFWILALILSLICCLFLFCELIVKVQKNPIIIERPDAAIHIENIPFPAISICSDIIQEGSTDRLELLQGLKNHSYKDMVRGRCVIMWVTRDCFKSDFNWLKFELAVNYWLPLEIQWLGQYSIEPVLTMTHLGWCKTFNIIDKNEMFHKNSTADYFAHKFSHNKPQNLSNFPLSTTKKEAGYQGMVVVPINEFSSCHFIQECNAVAVEKTVVVHSPYELPASRHKTINMRVEDLAKLFIVPRIKITDETLLHLDVDDRRCYTPDERQLQYFKTYTSINCLRECESSFILQKCGCVPYYFINNDTSLICSTSQLECFEKEFEEFEEVKCQCYPPCEEVTYEFVAQKSLLNTLKEEALIKVVVNFKDDSFYPQIRRKYFTMIDWFSFVGGILGLFFGFSFLSAFEVIFHAWMGVFGGKNRINFDDGKVFLRQQRKNESYGKIKAYVKDFLDSSSIHSFPYISKSDSRNSERLAWTISFILSITACAFMIRELNQKFAVDSTSIVSSHRVINITEIPFPCVTILSQFLIDVMSSFDDLLDPAIMTLMSLEKNGRNSDVIINNFSNLTIGPLFIPTIMKHSSIKQYKYVSVTWNKEFKVPAALMITPLGAGFSFNIAPNDEIVHVDRVSTDFTYQHEYHVKGGSKKMSASQPWKSPYGNSHIMDIHIDTRPFPPTFYIHSPYEYPIEFTTNEINAFEWEAGRKFEILVVPEIITSSDDFELLPLNQRLCFLKDEKKLKFFKIYTQRNCEIECLSEELLKTCGCVPFNVIRGKDTKICEFNNYDCIKEVRNKMSDQTSFLKNCNCLQPCNFITYSIEIIKTRQFLDPESFELLYQDNVKIGFQENEFTSMQRVQRFTVFDFLSYIGGLLGLFAGISVLSIFEIFYFFTLRLICEAWRIKRSRIRVEFGHAITFVAPIGMN